MQSLDQKEAVSFSSAKNSAMGSLGSLSEKLEKRRQAAKEAKLKAE
jgi:hypothetical protein